MKLTQEEACQIARQSILNSAYRGGLKLSGAKYTEHPSSLWGTTKGSLHGEWKIIFHKVFADGVVFEPNIIVIYVDAETGAVAKFPMI